VSDAPVSQALHALSRFLVADATLGDTLNIVSELAVEAMPGAAFAGIAMLDEGERVTTRVFTDPESPEIDQAQYDSGRGPCLDAWRQKRTIRLDEITSDGRGDYPEFTEACVARGIGSTLSLALVTAEQGVGALNLYARTPWGFTPDDQQVGEELATAASVVLANAAAYWGAFELSQQLDEAMKSRAVIEQAKGMLMAQSPGLDAEGAFDLLRMASQRENVKLREIAQRIVDRRPLTSDGA
jgi:GAF domain-containing protein